MSRSTLLGAASLAALVFTTGAFATQPAITGGGSTLAEFDYFVEFADFNAAQGTTTKAVFNNANPSPYGPATTNEGLYWASGSGTGQNSLLWDNLTCDANKTLKTQTVSPYCTAPSKVPSGVNLETIYGASDATLTPAQYTAWTNGTSYTDYAGTPVTVPAQPPIAGNLIELPSMGVGISFPIVNSGITTNGQVALEDSDLCGIFSGKITNWSTIAAETYNKNKGLKAGTIQVVYRSDSSGTTFILTEHLSAVCTSATSNITFTPVQTFASLFPNSTPPGNFVGESGSSAVANFISGYAGGSYTGSEIAYLSPDFTTIDPNSNATLTNASGTSVKSTLVVAETYNATKKAFYLPTEPNISLGLTHVLTSDTTLGSTGVPASVAEAEADNAFVPVPKTVSQGYPEVGYTTFDFAQCYKNSAISAALTEFVKYHYSTAEYTAVEINNGFVPLTKTSANAYDAAITKYIFPGTTDYGTEIESKSGCSGKTGR